MKQTAPVKSAVQERGNTAIAQAGEQRLVFADNRIAATAQRKLAASADKSPQAVAQQAFGEKIHGSSRMVAQRKLMMGDREIHRKTLFSGSAFKDRLTKWIDQQAAESDWALTRDDVRNELLGMIDDGDTHEYADTHEAVEAAIEMAIETVYGEIDASLIFGLDGRNLEQIKSAVQVGYRNFDCAESYGNTALLAQAIKDSGVDREEFEVNYKFDVRNEESAGDLEARLLAVAAQFGGSLDDLIIHNLDAPHDVIKAAWRVLHKMEQDGVVTNVGVGNVGVKDGELLPELEAIGEINVIENSVSSLLASPAISEMIKKTGAHVYFYDVVKTATEIGVNSEAGIKALIATVASSHGDSTAIMSSGNMRRQSQNIRKYGDSDKLKEINWDNHAEAAAGGKIGNWRNDALDQQTSEDNDEDFEMPAGVGAWLEGLLADTGEGVREQISEAAASDGEAVTPEFIETWLAENGGPSAADLRLAVPARTGLKKRYLGMSLGKVLAGLFGTSSCDWKWSLQLVILMSKTAEDWEGYLKFGADEITK